MNIIFKFYERVNLFSFSLFKVIWQQSCRRHYFTPAFYHKVQYFKAFTTKYNTLMLVQRLQYCRTNIKPA